MSLEYRVESLESEVRRCKSEIEAMRASQRARSDAWFFGLSALLIPFSTVLIALCFLKSP
jgi:hypothetical protein